MSSDTAAPTTTTTTTEEEMATAAEQPQQQQQQQGNLITGHWVRSRVAQAALGVSRRTLVKWAEAGWVRTMRAPGASSSQRWYDVSSLADGPRDPVSELTPPREVVYCRVARKHQRSSLILEVQRMHELFPGLHVYSDIGSGCNFERKALREILQLTLMHRISKIHVASEARLCTIGYGLLKWVLENHGAEICVFGCTPVQTCRRVDERQRADDVFDLMQEIMGPADASPPPTDDYADPGECGDADEEPGVEVAPSKLRRRLR